MAKIYDVIRDAQSGEAIDNLASSLGIPPEQAALAVQTILPELVKGLERNTLSRGGLADLVEAAGQGHHASVLDGKVALADPAVRMDGDAILGHILGSKDRSRQIAQRAAQTSGLSEGIIKMMLPILAQMLMGAIGKYLQGNLGDILKRIPGGATGAPAPSRPGSGRNSPARFPSGSDPSEAGGQAERPRTGFELPRSERPAGGYSLPPISPDAPGSGDGAGRSGTWPGGNSMPRGGRSPWPSDAPPSSGSRPAPGAPFPEQRPLPLPGDLPAGDNPFGNLPDILRRGGRTTDGAPVGRSIRDILGSLLGFKSGGVLSWILRLIFLRFGWGILRRILGAAFGRR